MDKVLKINKSVEKGIIDLLKFLLESKKINGVFTLRKLGQNNVDYALITDVSGLNDAVPFYPLMPANAGKILSYFTQKKPINKPIAAVLKPCELRAFIELVKREQGSLDNFLFISSSCGGVLPIKSVEQKDFDKYISNYWDTVKNANISADIRPTCKACEYFTPYNADITVSLVGEKKLDKECRIFLNTDKANQVVKGFDGEITEEDFGSSEILCDFESDNYDYSQSDYEKELHKKGGLRLPPDTIFFQIGRLTHMSFSCVGCGMCSDACPVDIPVAAIFQKTGEETRQLFDYLPGKDVEETIPVMIFKEEEFTELGE